MGLPALLVLPYLYDRAAYPGRGRVHRDDHQGYSYYGSTCLVPLEQVDVLDQYIADAASTHQADNRGHADVPVPRIQGERNELWDELGYNGVSDHLEPVGTRGRNSLDRPRVDRFDSLGIELTKRCNGVQSERK